MEGHMHSYYYSMCAARLKEQERFFIGEFILVFVKGWICILSQNAHDDLLYVTAFQVSPNFYQILFPAINAGRFPFIGCTVYSTYVYEWEQRQDQGDGLTHFNSLKKKKKISLKL